MKITKYIWLIFVIGLYAINYFWLKISIWTYTGIVLGILLVLVVTINIFIKIKNRKGKTKTDDDFIFPTKVANTMKAIDISIQYESSILSLFCLMMGMLLFVIYVIFIAPYNLITKIFIVFNTICGLGLMGSMLVTNYQQFVAHKESTKMLNDFATQFGTEILSPDKIKSGALLLPLEACVDGDDEKGKILKEGLKITDESELKEYENNNNENNNNDNNVRRLDK
jgi:hypothetical protein